MSIYFLQFRSRCSIVGSVVQLVAPRSSPDVCLLLTTPHRSKTANRITSQPKQSFQWPLTSVLTDPAEWLIGIFRRWTFVSGWFLPSICLQGECKLIFTHVHLPFTRRSHRLRSLFPYRRDRSLYTKSNENIKNMTHTPSFNLASSTPPLPSTIEATGAVADAIVRIF